MRVETEVKEGKVAESPSQRSVKKQDPCRLDGSRSRPALSH